MTCPQGNLTTESPQAGNLGSCALSDQIQQFDSQQFDRAPQFQFVVTPELSGIRIDSFLIKHLRNYNPWRMQRIAHAGGVTINCARAEQADRVYTGQLVTVRLLEPPDKLLAALGEAVPVVYRDPWIMVVEKPAGMISHPVGDFAGATLANVLQAMLDESGPGRGLLRPGLVHRLDRETSGLMVVALTHDAHVPLAASFENSHVAKEYLALVEGVLQPDQGTWDWPIGRAATGRHVLMSCRPDSMEKRAAKTAFEVVERFPAHTFLRTKPRTGRNHQIRVHCAHAGHPLVGDEFYEAHGKFKPFLSQRPDAVSPEADTGFAIARHALHAARLQFPHPITGAWLDFQSDPPEDFRATVLELRSQQAK